VILESLRCAGEVVTLSTARFGGNPANPKSEVVKRKKRDQHRGPPMSLSFFAAVEEIREAAMEYRLPGPRKQLLWATILSQVAKTATCDGSLADLLLEIIRAYVKKPDDKDIMAMWLETESGGGDDPEELFADCVRIDLEMELLAEVTRIAWDEARPPKRKRK
jgi:hypothetical protein